MVKANKVLAGLSLAENKDFEACKRAILNYFRLDAPAYQKKFRQARKGHDETYKMFKSRILDYFMYYVDARGIGSVDELIDVVCEQLLSVFSPEIKAFVLAKQAKTADEYCHFADLFGKCHVALEGLCLRPRVVHSP